MEKKIYSLRTNVGYFYNKPIGFTRDFHQEYEDISISEDLRLKNFVMDYSLSRTREGLLMRTKLKAKIETQCSRCIETFFAPVESEFQELYAFRERFHQETDEETIPDDGYLDFGVLFRDYLLIELPMNSVCREDCKGVCVQCGKNLNEGDCEHTESRIVFD